MLVTLGSGEEISAGSSQTYTYACNSVQGVMIRTEDSADSQDGHVTIQVGNEVICNDIDFTALAFLTRAKGGLGSDAASSADMFIDLGSHVLDANESLYVTIRNSDTANLLGAVDISALVDGQGTYAPIKVTNYADKVFTDSNTLEVYAWATTSLDEDASAMTIRNSAGSSSPAILSGVSWVMRDNQLSSNYIAKMCSNQVPLNTTVNYTSTNVSGVLCVSAMDRLPSKQADATRTGRNLVRSMSSTEAKAL